MGSLCFVCLWIYKIEKNFKVIVNFEVRIKFYLKFIRVLCICNFSFYMGFMLFDIL